MNTICRFLLAFILVGIVESSVHAASAQPKDESMIRLHVNVGATRFVAVLHDNESTRALLPLMPLTVTMNELNNNEKYAVIAQKLPNDARRVGRIDAGDLMLYGTDYLVLFYDGLDSVYRYTPLGRIEDATGLAAALGAGSVSVRFDIAAD